MSQLRLISPFKCRMWEMHDRLGEDINEDSCASLVQSIRKHGQQHAVLGRTVHGSGSDEVELIYGARRLFAAQQLGIDLLVDVRAIDDREALVQMDIENRIRRDISSYERGLNYRHWLRLGYFSNQSELAKCLGVSEPQVSRLLKYSELPTAIVSAFPSPRDIREEWAVALVKCCRDSSFRHRMLGRARKLSASKDALSPHKVYDALVNDQHADRVRYKPRDEVIRDAAGKPIMRIALLSKSVRIVILDRQNLTSSMLRQITDRIRDIVESNNSKADVGRSSNRIIAIRDHAPREL